MRLKGGSSNIVIYQKLTPALLSILLVDFTANGLLRYELLISPIIFYLLKKTFARHY